MSLYSKPNWFGEEGGYAAPPGRLWSLLNRRQLGVVFRRQVVVLGRYIADFLAPSLKLIVEVDGGCHAQRVRADARRDEALRRAGYRVVRVSAELVLREPEEAVRLLQYFCR